MREDWGWSIIQGGFLGTWVAIQFFNSTLNLGTSTSLLRPNGSWFQTLAALYINPDLEIVSELLCEIVFSCRWGKICLCSGVRSLSLEDIVQKLCGLFWDQGWVQLLPGNWSAGLLFRSNTKLPRFFSSIRATREWGGWSWGGLRAAGWRREVREDQSTGDCFNYTYMWSSINETLLTTYGTFNFWGPFFWPKLQEILSYKIFVTFRALYRSMKTRNERIF